MTIYSDIHMLLFDLQWSIDFFMLTKSSLVKKWGALLKNGENEYAAYSVIPDVDFTG